MFVAGHFTGIVLFFVGWVFILNGLHALGRVGNKEAGWFNLVISLLMFLWIIRALVTNYLEDGTIWFVAGVTMFALTYLGLAGSYLLELDGRGLGWYCLWVAVVAPYIGYQNFVAGDVRFGIIWLVWAVAWFCFWLILGLGKSKVMSKLKYFMIPVGVLTAWVPGFMLMNDMW